MDLPFPQKWIQSSILAKIDVRYFVFPKHKGCNDGSTLKLSGRLDCLLPSTLLALSRRPGKACSSFLSEKGTTTSDLYIPWSRAGINLCWWRKVVLSWTSCIHYQDQRFWQSITLSEQTQSAIRLVSPACWARAFSFHSWIKVVVCILWVHSGSSVNSFIKANIRRSPTVRGSGPSPLDHFQYIHQVFE